MLKKLIIIFFLLNLVLINVFLDLVVQNIQQIDFVLLVDLTKIFVFVISISTLILYLINIIFKTNPREVSFTFIFFVYLNFYFSNFKIFFSNYFNQYDGEISLSFILLLTCLFYKFIFKKKMRSVFYLFYTFLFIYNSSLISLNIVKEKNINNTNVKTTFYSKEDIKKITSSSYKPNIYYLILDSMMSLETFDNNFKKDVLQKNTKILNDKNFVYVNNSVSNYTTTYLSMSALLNLDIMIDDKGPQYKNRSNFYPNTLKNDNGSVLINELKKIGYNFKLSGIPAWNCEFNKKYCLSYNNNNNTLDKKVYYLENPHNHELNEMFLELTILGSLYSKLHSLNNKINRPLLNYYHNAHETNDVIEKFIKIHKSLNKDIKPTFFLIHHWSPHWPHIFNIDCSLKFNHLEKKDNSKDGYKDAYLCVLKKITSFINYINKNDKDAIVVIQGNHGDLDFRNERYEDLKTTFSIFSAFKVNDSCKNKIKNVQDSINSIRFILSCPFGIENKLIEKKQYIGFYEQQKNYGKIFTYEDYSKLLNQ